MLPGRQKEIHRAPTRSAVRLARSRLDQRGYAEDHDGIIRAGWREDMVGKLANVLKANGRFINRAIIDMTDDRPGGGMAARQKPDEIPPD